MTVSDLTPLWTVSQLKSKLAPTTLAAGKQKLVFGEVVLKNSLTLHQCGLVTGAILTLVKK